jgi:hypothetical protein
MVDVGVRENDGVEVLDRNRKRTVLLRRFLTLSLKHPTVEGDCIPVDLQQVTRSGDFPGGTDEGYLQQPAR